MKQKAKFNEKNVLLAV